MTENTTKLKPTREEAVTSLLCLGKCLHDYLYLTRDDQPCPSPTSPHEAERLKAEISKLEKEIEVSAYDANQRLLRSTLGIKGNEVLSFQVLRCLAIVVWHSLATDRPVSLGKVTQAITLNDLSETLEARRTIRMLIFKGDTLCYRDKDFSSGQLYPGAKLVKLLSGENNVSVLWTQKIIEEEREECRRRNEDAHRRSQSPFKLAQSVAQIPLVAPIAFGASESPKAIFEALRQTVIGIDPVVKKFSVQMAMHLKRLAIIASGKKPTLPPVCCLLIGPSGCGKSHIACEVGKLLNIPFCIADMTSITASSYVGSSVDEIYLDLIRRKVPIADIQKALIFLDEIDKKRTNNRDGDFDSAGSGVQYELLRMLEGTRMQIGGKRSNDNAKGFLDSASMAFVLAGAFSDIADKLRMSTKEPLGFSNRGQSPSVPPDTRELLLDYFIPEFVNRIGSVIVIPTPSLFQLIQIATAPIGIIARQNQFLATFGLQVMPTPEAVKVIASWSLETRTFSRGMRSLMQVLVEEALFDEIKGEVVIGVDDVQRAIAGFQEEPKSMS